MALLFMDGFDYYESDQIDDLAGKWNPTGGFQATAINAVTGFGGVGKAIQMRGLGAITRTWAGVDTIIFGCYIQLNSFGSDTTFGFYDLHTLQFSIGTDGADHFVVRRGTTTILGTSSSTFSTGVWYHLEAKIKCSNTVGEIELRIDEVVEIGPLTSQDTSLTTTELIDAIYIFGDNAVLPTLDALYIMDTTGSRLNDFIGKTVIETIYSDGVGAAADFTPSAGSNWENVDEEFPDHDATYNEDTVVSSKDRFTCGDLVTEVDSIHAVAVNIRAKKMEAGPVTIRAIAHDGTTEGEGGDEYFAYGDYMWRQHIFEDHPSGAAVWTASEVDGGQFGYKIQA